MTVNIKYIFPINCSSGKIANTPSATCQFVSKSLLQQTSFSPLVVLHEPHRLAIALKKMGLNVLFHGDGGQSFFDFPNQVVLQNLMGVVALAANQERFWGGGSGLQRTDGVAHAAAVNSMIQDVRIIALLFTLDAFKAPAPIYYLLLVTKMDPSFTPGRCF